MCHQTNANGYRYLRGLRLLSGCVATPGAGSAPGDGIPTEQKVRRD